MFDNGALQPSRYDDVFKFIFNNFHEYAGVDSGDVEAPTGWFGMVHIDSHMIMDAVKATGNAAASSAGAVVTGLYTARINSDGIIWVHFYEGPNHETLAEKDWEWMVAEYNNWRGDEFLAEQRLTLHRHIREMKRCLDSLDKAVDTNGPSGPNTHAALSVLGGNLATLSEFFYPDNDGPLS